MALSLVLHEEIHMKDVSFHEIIITKDSQKIVSADARIYEALGSFITKPMNELIAIEDIDIYSNNIKNCDGKWYPSKIISPDTMYYTYIRAASDNDKLIRLTVVNAKNLLNAHSTLMDTINTFKAHLDLYEDVMFEYNPASGLVNVYNTVLADFENGSYSLDEFEALLLRKADESQIQAIKGFITQVKTKVGRSTTIVDGNLLNDDANITNTVLNEAYISYNKDSDGVVGNIRLQRNRGNYSPNVLKHDSLTGLIDKADIIKIARERIDDKLLYGTALAIIDIDFFKNINDTYGHQFGDDVIKKTAEIISNEVGNNGVAGRFGGDEFFVVFYNIKDENDLGAILMAIKAKVNSTFPDKGIDKDNPLSVSIGAAIYTNNVDGYDDLFMLADHCLYLAKEKGRNRYVIYNPDEHGDIDSVRLEHQTIKKINERDLSYGDVLVKMFDITLHDLDSTIENFMAEFAEAFDLQNIALFAGNPFKHIYSAGSQAVYDKETLDFALNILNSSSKDIYFALGDFIVINTLGTLPPHVQDARSFLENKGIYSLVIQRFYDKDNRECVLVITSVGKKTQWNQTHFKYYRAFADLLSLHSIK